MSFLHVKQVSSTGMTVGDFISFYAVVNMLNSSLRELATGTYHVFLGQESLVKTMEWLQAEDAEVYTGDGEIALAKSLELRGVSFSYKPGIPVLTDFRLKLNRGETVIFNRSLRDLKLPTSLLDPGFAMYL